MPFIKYVYIKLNAHDVIGVIKSNGLNRIAKIGHLCLREENLSNNPLKIKSIARLNIETLNRHIIANTIIHHLYAINSPQTGYFSIRS